MLFFYYYFYLFIYFCQKSSFLAELAGESVNSLHGALGGGGREGKRGHFPLLSQCFLPSLFKLTGRGDIYEDYLVLFASF